MLSQLLGATKMPEIELVVLNVHQSIGTLYVAVMKGRDLYDVARSDRLRLEELKVPKYAGFQRALDPNRVAAIRDYLQTPRATFPNAIILSIDSDYVGEWRDLPDYPGVSRLTLNREEGAVTIIDGQHRAAALDVASEDVQVVVTFFLDLEMVRKAEVFAKINSTQKAVNPSIAFQLFGYAEDRSPQRTAHEIAQVLNSTEGSPFYKQLRMVGTKDAWALGRLSQSTFCKELMTLYTRNATEDEYRLLRNQSLNGYPGFPMREWFIKKKDKQVLETFWKFFYNIASTWPEQWADDAGQSILLKTTGYSAWVAVMKKWLLSDRGAQVRDDTGVREALATIAAAYQQPNTRFVRDNYPAGNQGKIKLRDALLASLELA
jgi:DGQHR domain-containing protein